VSSKRAGSTAQLNEGIKYVQTHQDVGAIVFSLTRERERKTERYKSNVNNRQNGKKKHPAFQTILGY
jgi:hypothetical protein